MQREYCHENNLYKYTSEPYKEKTKKGEDTQRVLDHAEYVTRLQW